jgi:hypothetical protein
MDSATQDLLHQRIDELVYDEEKIVSNNASFYIYFL